MTCRSMPIPGGFAIVCTRGQRTQPCRECRAPGEYLCDAPGTGEGGTCSAPMCRAHRHHFRGPARDICSACLPKPAPRPNVSLCACGAEVVLSLHGSQPVTLQAAPTQAGDLVLAGPVGGPYRVESYNPARHTGRNRWALHACQEKL